MNVIAKEKVCKANRCTSLALNGYEFCYHHFKKVGKKNKYNAKKQTYNNYNYDSIKEAQYAAQLDLRIKAGEVLKWERQFKIDIRINEIHITNYYIDFKVYLADGSIEYHEVKGAETMLWRVKWRLSKALNPNWKFVLIK